jgi:hypothetical protein
MPVGVDAEPHHALLNPEQLYFALVRTQLNASLVERLLDARLQIHRMQPVQD